MKLFLKKSWPFIALAVLAFIVHVAFLSYPSQVVFDEVHFGKFVGAYFTGQYYFDIHPPLGKLMIAGWAWLNGVVPNFDFSHIGEQASPHMFFVLRFLPALFGALFVLIFSWLTYLISRSKIAALISGFLILCDSAFLVQSRFILVDIFMLCFGALALCFFFLQQRQKPFGAKWLLALIATSVSFGLAISIKWTGVATIGIIGLILLARIFSKRLNQYLAGQPTGIDEPSAPHKAKIFAEGAISIIFLLVIGFSVYVIPFVIHFDLLQRSGPGDAFMSQQFQQELKYGRQSVEQPLSFWQKFVELNKTMYTASAGITAFHPYSSRWYNWPFDDKPIYYWNQNLPSNQVAKIYFLGNPVLWWLAGAFIITTLLTSTRRSWRKKISPIFYILLLGYFANLLPFIFIKRTSFLYHYLPPVTFGILLVSLWLANLWPKDKKILLLTLTIVAAVFVFLIPLCYGLPMSPPLNGVEMNLIQLLS